MFKYLRWYKYENQYLTMREAI